MLKRTHIQEYSDEDLVRKYQLEGNKEFLAELFERYLRFVFLISFKYLKNEDLAKDLAMDVFEKLVVDLKRFEVKNFKSWLHVVTKNACMMHFRKADSTIVSLDQKKESDRVMETGEQLHPENAMKKELQLQQLEKAMETLETGQKECVQLFYLSEKSYIEVADLTGYSMNQVKSFIQNGKRNLKNYLLANGEFVIYFFALLYLFD